MPDWFWDFLRWSFGERELAFMRQVPMAVGKIAAVITVCELIAFSLLFSWFYGERIETLRERIQSRDDQIGRLKTQVAESLKGKNEVQSRPYTISKEDEVEFIQMLSSAGRYEVVIEHLSGNETSLALAKRMKAVLEGCWNIRSFDTTVIGGDSPTGVIIRANTENGTPLGASLLQALLKKRYIETQIEGFALGEGESRLLKIFVGSDPQTINK